MQNQKVYEGKTMSGIHGIFTGGMLVHSIKPDGQFSILDKRNWFELTLDQKREAVKRLGYILCNSEGIPL